MPPAPVELPENKASKLADLRALLAAKFPDQTRPHADLAVPSGLPQLDAQIGGLRRGSVTELAGSLGNGGLFLDALLHAAQGGGCFFALVDGGPSFDLGDRSDALLARMLWVRCREAECAVKAADLLIRDGNLPLVALDLRMLPWKQVRRIPATTWHRFQLLVEVSQTALLVFSLQPVVEGARIRVGAPQRWKLEATEEDREQLVRGMELRIYERCAGAAVTSPALQVLSA